MGRKTKGYFVGDNQYHCEYCENTKKINEFPKDKTNNKGFMSRCKVCFNKYQKIRKLHIEYIELGVKFKTLLDEL